MLWYSFASCDGNPEILREKIESIPHHISDRHFYPENEHYRYCAHGDLSEEERGEKLWLDPEGLVNKSSF